MHKTYTYSLIKNHCNAVVNTAMYVSNAAKHSVASLKEPTASAQKQAKVSCVDFCVFETEQKANIQVKSNSLKKRAKSTNTNGALHSPFLSLIFVYFLSRKSKKKDLTLKLVNFAGTTPNFSGYTFTWLLNGAPVGTNSHTITTNQPGTVSVSFSSTQSPNYVCDAEVDILAKPCISPNTPTSCGIPAILVPPTIVAASMPLAVGATFIAGGDYTVTITNISGSTASGYTGTGYVALKLYGPLALNRMAVDFTNLKVDPCFAMAAGSLKSQYDPGWGGIVDLDGVVNSAKELIARTRDYLEDHNNYIDLIKQSIIEFTFAKEKIVKGDFTAEYINEQKLLYDNVISSLTCLVPAANQRLAICDVSIAKTKLTELEFGQNSSINPYAGDVFDENGIFLPSESTSGKYVILKNNARQIWEPLYKILPSVDLRISGFLLISRILLYYWTELGYPKTMLNNSNFDIMERPDSVSIYTIMETECNANKIYIYLDNFKFHAGQSFKERIKSYLVHEKFHLVEKLACPPHKVYYTTDEHIKVYFMQFSHIDFNKNDREWIKNLYENSVLVYMSAFINTEKGRYNYWLKIFKSLNLGLLIFLSICILLDL